MSIYTSLPPLRCHFAPSARLPGAVRVWRRINGRLRVVETIKPDRFGTRTKGSR